MLGRFIVSVMLVIIGSNTYVAAQACQVEVECAIYDMWTGHCVPKLPAGVHDCWVKNNFSTVCTVPTWMCFVPAAVSQGTDCPTCGGKPINLTTGNVYIVETDFAIPGLGGGLSLTRTWNSKYPSSEAGTQVGLFGRNWSTTYEERIFLGNDGLLRLMRSTGSFWVFGFDSNSADGNAVIYKLAAPQDGGLTLISDWNQYTVLAKDGTKKTYSQTSGWLTSIVDRNGNTTTLTYDGLSRLSQVTDPVGPEHGDDAER